MTAGRRAPASTAAAASSAAPSGSGTAIATGGAITTSARSSSTSNGISMCCGRGRPEAIVAKAWATATGISSTLPTRWLTPTMPSSAPVRSRVSCRWPAPRPGRRSGIPADTSSTGTESEYACPSAVAALSTAGPEVVMHTPGRPVTRAKPSAANPAPCSWRGSTCRMPAAVRCA